MGLMSRFNRGGVVFDVNTDGFKYVKLEDLWQGLADNEKDQVFKIDGLYVNTKSSFGAHPVAIMAEQCLLVDLPGHLMEDVKEILETPEVVEAIKAGAVGFTIQQYTDKKFKKLCYSIHWEDIE